jgi:uncharacterized protein (DUF849 family)
VIRRIKACLNGGRTRDDHPAVPVTPAELVRRALVLWDSQRERR